MLIHCARERGLAQVFEQLLGFDGCEFYIQEWPELVGLTFGEVIYRFADAVVIGLIRSSSSSNEPTLPLLNPPNDLIVLSGDRIVVIAEDDDTYSASSTPLYTDLDHDELLKYASTYQPRKKLIEKILILGWKQSMIGMLNEFDASACSGSELSISSPLPIDFRQVFILFLLFLLLYPLIYINISISTYSFN